MPHSLAWLRTRLTARWASSSGPSGGTPFASPGRRGWRIALPEGDTTLADRAVSTSGDTEQFVIIDGVRYSHVIDPRTGMGLTSRRAATVVAPDGLTADPLATALTVLDDERGARLLRAFPQAVARVRRHSR